MEKTITTASELGEIIRHIRTSQGCTFRGLAAECGLSPQTLQNIENGAFAPRLDIVLTILDKLGARMVISRQ